MPRAAATALAALALLTAFASCGDEPTDPFDDARCEGLRNDPETADAFDWLKGASPVPRWAGKWPPEKALALAHKFEARGAKRLFAVGNRKLEPPVAKSPHLFSLGLLIELPDEPGKRFQVFTLYAQSVGNNGYRPRADTGQKYVFFGWPQDGSNLNPDLLKR